MIRFLLFAFALTAGLQFFGSEAAAAEKTIKVTSFYALNGSRGASEICGVVTGHAAGDYIVVTVDPKKAPAVYNTFPSPTGHWCLMVNSAYGLAEAVLYGSSTSFDAQMVPVNNDVTRYKKP